MRFFWKTVAANIVATILMLLVAGLVLFVGLAILVRGLLGTHQETTHPNSVLVFDMGVAITDSPAHAVQGPSFSPQPARLALYDVVDALDQAAKDRNITALYLTGSFDTSDSASGYATLREVRQAIGRFEAAGKKVYAYLDEPTLRDYYMASAANEVALNPFGFLSINGLTAQTLFVHGAMQKYGVGVQVTRVGKYKSATEIFTEDHMSDADREQLTGLLGDIWGTLSTEMAASRKLDPAAFKKLAAEPGLYLAKDALDKKLVDKLAYLDQMIDELEKVGSYDSDNETFTQISLATYARRLAEKRELAANSPFAPSNRIAIVYAEGDIVDGGNGADSVGGDEMASILREIRNDKHVKAVVLRVNSPGGSALASELIQREVRNLRDAKIPVVVSMGTYAASGGYWISAYSDYIYAEPTTVTGSIGVFGLHFDFQDIAAQHGLTFDTVKTVPNSDMDSVVRPWTPDEQKLAQTLVDFLYDQFIAKVAEGRHLQPDQVRAIAQGRVWSGTEAVAKDKGLVNALGGLGDAITKAAELANLKDQQWTLVQYPEKRLPFQAIAQALAGGGEPGPVSQLAPLAGRDPVAATLRQVQSQWSFLRSFNDPRGLYARLPYVLQF
ncbi:MAG TPA: signal peptide peptidase SppA [Opitutales bacterium]|nr:signal peptide peptidase SppA [Opitutales bacterium]